MSYKLWNTVGAFSTTLCLCFLLFFIIFFISSSPISFSPGTPSLWRSCSLASASLDETKLCKPGPCFWDTFVSEMHSVLQNIALLTFGIFHKGKKKNTTIAPFSMGRRRDFRNACCLILLSRDRNSPPWVAEAFCELKAGMALCSFCFSASVGSFATVNCQKPFAHLKWENYTGLWLGLSIPCVLLHIFVLYTSIFSLSFVLPAPGVHQHKLRLCDLLRTGAVTSL